MLHVLRWTLCSCIWCGDERQRRGQAHGLSPYILGKERTESLQMAAWVKNYRWELVHEFKDVSGSVVTYRHFVQILLKLLQQKLLYCDLEPFLISHCESLHCGADNNESVSLVQLQRNVFLYGSRTRGRNQQEHTPSPYLKCWSRSCRQNPTGQKSFLHLCMLSLRHEGQSPSEDPGSDIWS